MEKLGPSRGQVLSGRGVVTLLLRRQLNESDSVCESTSVALLPAEGNTDIGRPCSTASCTVDVRSKVRGSGRTRSTAVSTPSRASSTLHSQSTGAKPRAGTRSEEACSVLNARIGWRLRCCRVPCPRPGGFRASGFTLGFAVGPAYLPLARLRDRAWSHLSLELSTAAPWALCPWCCAAGHSPGPGGAPHMSRVPGKSEKKCALG